MLNNNKIYPILFGKHPDSHVVLYSCAGHLIPDVAAMYDPQLITYLYVNNK